MIICTVIFVLIILLLAILLSFVYYILNPSIKNIDKDEDPLISNEEISTIEYKEPETERSDKKALVLCSCNKKFALEPISFTEEYTCSMVKALYGSVSDCKFACIGLGDCIKVCPQEAISIVNNTAVISNLCIGCGKCAEICPQKIISMVPSDTQKIRLCSKTEAGYTSCSHKENEEKVVWDSKKDFKIWAYCYRMFKHTKK